jgi:hypothetical protein
MGLLIMSILIIELYTCLYRYLINAQITTPTPEKIKEIINSIENHLSP